MDSEFSVNSFFNNNNILLKIIKYFTEQQKIKYRLKLGITYKTLYTLV